MYERDCDCHGGLGEFDREDSISSRVRVPRVRNVEVAEDTYLMPADVVVSLLPLLQPEQAIAPAPALAQGDRMTAANRNPVTGAMIRDGDRYFAYPVPAPAPAIVAPAPIFSAPAPAPIFSAPAPAPIFSAPAPAPVPAPIFSAPAPGIVSPWPFPVANEARPGQPMDWNYTQPVIWAGAPSGDGPIVNQGSGAAPASSVFPIGAAIALALLFLS